MSAASISIFDRWFSQLAWYGQKHLYFTSSFWWRLDLLWLRLVSDEPSAILRWLDMSETFACLVFGVTCCYFITTLAVLNIADTKSLASDQRAVKTIDELKAITKSSKTEYEASPPNNTFNMLPSTSRIIGLLQLLVHDLLFYLTRKVSGRSLTTQICVHIWLNVMQSPLHALHTQSIVVEKGEALPALTWTYYLGLSRLLFWPTFASSASKSFAISIILWCLREITDRPPKEIRSLEIIGFFIVVGSAWMLFVPTCVALISAELSLLSENVKTSLSIQRSGLAGEAFMPWGDTQDSVHLLRWSWQFVTARKTRLFAILMLIQAILVSSSKPAL